MFVYIDFENFENFTSRMFVYIDFPRAFIELLQRLDRCFGLPFTHKSIKNNGKYVSEARRGRKKFPGRLRRPKRTPITLFLSNYYTLIPGCSYI